MTTTRRGSSGKGSAKKRSAPASQRPTRRSSGKGSKPSDGHQGQNGITETSSSEGSDDPAISHFNNALMSRVFMAWRRVCRVPRRTATLLDAVNSDEELESGGDGRADESPMTGLRNVGNTCFMNSVLQVLCNTTELSTFLLDRLDLFGKGDETDAPMTSAERVKRRRAKMAAKTNGERPRPQLKRMSTTDLLRDVSKRRKLSEKPDVYLAVELQNLLRVLKSKQTDIVTPYALLSAIWFAVPRFRGYQQQDAQEFLVYLLNSLSSELKTLAPSQSQQNAIQRMFGGKLTTQVTCQRCRHQSSTTEPFNDLSLDIPGTADPPKGAPVPKESDPVRLFASPPRVRSRGSNAANDTRTGNEPSVSLPACLDSFTRQEHMARTELYDCINCKSKQGAKKKISISALPDVLILHLKRFRYSAAVRSKIDTHVNFPVDALDMAPYCTKELFAKDPCLYTLYGVVPHHGTGWGSGHYTAYSFSPEENEWFHYNDASVSPATMREVNEAQAYLLFYTRIKTGT